MAVPKHRVSRARRNQRRGHDKMTSPTLSTHARTGTTHRRHHLTPEGYTYDGRQVTRHASIEDESEID